MVPPEDGEMTAEYELGLDDWDAFEADFLRHSKAARWRIRGLQLALLGFAGLVLAQGLRASRPLPDVLVATGVLAAISLFAPSAGRWVTRKIRQSAAQAGKNRGAYGRQRCELTRDYIRLKNSAGDVKIDWSAIVRVSPTRGHLFIYLSRQSGFIVPTRAFRDEATLRAFTDEVLRRCARP
jgi:hypothetical protein